MTAVCGNAVYETSLGGKTLEAGKLYRVAKDMMASSAYIAPVQARKGDLALDDGTFLANSYFTAADGGFSALSAEEQTALKSRVRGIVFWTTADTDLTDANRQTPAKLSDDKVMAADFPRCTHGLIVSLTDVSSGCVWQSSSKSVYNTFQNTDHFMPANKGNYAAIQSGTGATDNINKILGYNNTKVLEAYNTYCSNNDRSDYVVKPVVALATWQASNPAPLNSTGWFLPSLKELTLLCGVDTDNVYGGGFGHSTKFTMMDLLATLGKEKISDTNYYWSSSEFTVGTFAYDVRFSFAIVYQDSKNSVCRVRAVCAF